MSYSRIIPSHSKKNRHSIVHCSLSHLSGFSMILYQNGTRTEPGRNQTSTRPVPDRYQKVHWPWNYNLMQKPTWVNWRDEKWNIHLKISVIFSRELLNLTWKCLSLLLSWYFLFLYDYISDLNAYFVSKMTYVYIQVTLTNKMENILILKFGRSRSRRF